MKMNEIVEQCKNIKIKIEGCNATTLNDCLRECYYEGMLADTPKHLLNCDVLQTGYSYGSKCAVIDVPFQTSKKV